MADGQAVETSDEELNTIRLGAARLRMIQLRLSVISWWMRILFQQIARDANTSGPRCSDKGLLLLSLGDYLPAEQGGQLIQTFPRRRLYCILSTKN